MSQTENKAVSWCSRESEIRLVSRDVCYTEIVGHRDAIPAPANKMAPDAES